MNNEMKSFVKPNKATLSFIKNEDKTKKVMIYGFDGAGKSHFAQKYCEDNGLKPVCFDFLQTNRSCPNIIKFKARKTAKQNAQYFSEIISQIQESEYDTLVIDDITFFFELLIGKGAGLSKYSERGEHWTKLRQDLLDSDLNLIFIGQIDTDIEYDKNSTEKAQPSKVMVSVHSLCNEKYFCEHNKNGYSQIVRKYRGHGDWVGKMYDEIKTLMKGGYDL